jgi:hypothetical protein
MSAKKHLEDHHLGRMFYGQMIQKYTFLDEMGPIMPGEDTAFQTPDTAFHSKNLI